MNSDIKPPRWIQSLLQRFADDETLEEVEGDLIEFYNQWVVSMGPMRANWKYFFTAVTLLRPLKKKRKEFSTNTLSMIRSYFVMSWRTILKNKLSSIINLSGLTLGLTTSLLILLVVLREFEYDSQHLKKDVVFVMMKNQKTNDGISTGRSTPGPIVEALKSDFPQVVHAARIARFQDIAVMVNDKKFSGSGIYVDPDIFRMMTYPAVKGDPTTALEKNLVVISSSVATKLYGDQNPIGQTITIGGNSLTIGAIIKDIPGTNSLKFQMAVPFRVFEKNKNNNWLSKWDDNRIQSWVELRSADDLAEFNEAVYSLVTKHTLDENESLFAYPLSRLQLHGHFSNGHPSGGMITFVWILIGFGVFMLLIACVNFMNIATAQSSRRAREVGVRKVLGAAQRWIVFQFLNESLVITFVSLLAAIGLCILLIPSFNLMMHTSIAFEFDNAVVWVMCVSVALVTAIIAGSYPAFVLSNFMPVRVLKGIIDHPGGLSLRRVLVTFQFFISILVLVGTVILYAQFDYVKKRPVGYEQENLVNIQLDSLASARFDVVKNEVSKINGVRSATGTNGNILYSYAGVTGMDWPGKKAGEDVGVSMAQVDYDWSKTMGIEIVSGRDFSPEIKSDQDGCLLNQAAVERMGLTNPVGSIVGGHAVVGVYKNFVFNNPSGVIAPMMILFSPPEIHHLYVRIENTEAWTETMGAVEKAVRKVSPDIEFEFHFTTDEYEANFEELNDVGFMVSIFGGMTIFISCLGLFGLSGFVAERRGKEMSIRKVFGADSIRVLISLSADILKPVVVALLIVIPLSIWIGGMLLELFVYHVSMQWWMFAQAGVAVIAIAFLVVLYHALRTAKESPSVRLKSE